jgi:hypothetical protein
MTVVLVSMMHDHPMTLLVLMMDDHHMTSLVE